MATEYWLWHSLREAGYGVPCGAMIAYPFAPSRRSNRSAIGRQLQCICSIGVWCNVAWAISSTVRSGIVGLRALPCRPHFPSLTTLGGKPGPPGPHGRRRDLNCTASGVAGHAVGRGQQHRRLHHLPLRRGLKTGRRPQERTLTGDTGNGAAGLFTVQFYRQATYYLQDT